MWNVKCYIILLLLNLPQLVHHLFTTYLALLFSHCHPSFKFDCDIFYNLLLTTSKSLFHHCFTTPSSLFTTLFFLTLSPLFHQSVTTFHLSYRKHSDINPSINTSIHSNIHISNLSSPLWGLASIRIDLSLTALN